MREGAGRKPCKGLVAMPAGHGIALARIPSREEVALRAENKRLNTALGVLQGKWDAMARHEQQAIAARTTALQREADALHELACANTQIAHLRAVAAPAPVPAAATAPPAPKKRDYNSESSRKRAVRKLRKFLQLYPDESQADLVARAIVVDGRGKESGLSVGLVKQLLSAPRMKRAMVEHAEAILARAREHMMQNVFSASNMVTARRLLRLSDRKLQWLRRLLSHTGTERRVMHPEYDTSVPVLPSIPEMKADEQSIVDEHGGVTQQEDGKGATCESLPRVLCQAIANAHKQGTLSSAGTESDPHIFMWGGDGFLARKNSKWCQLGVILCSTRALNQSPNDSRFVMAWKGGEDYDILNIRMDDLRPDLQRLAREGRVWDEEGELPLGVGRHVKFALGGDKPWIHTVAGRRNMNHTFFSASCKCSREHITCLDCEGGQEGHYQVDADEMCRRAHVCPNMWLRGGAFVSFQCPCCSKSFRVP